MDTIKENKIRQEQIESFGRLMAGFSHDMKNHLGIIRESNGLMEDILAMDPLCEDKNTAERLKKSIAAIERRVSISSKMFQHLSRIAHRPDASLSSFLVNDLIEELYTFMERFSRLQQIDVIIKFGDNISPVVNDPALLQHIIYRLYMLTISQLEAGNNLLLTTESHGEDTNLILSYSRSQANQPEDLLDGTLADAIEKLGGKIKLANNEDNITKLNFIIKSVTEKQ